MKIKLSIAISVFFILSTSFGQNSLPYESKIADLGRMKMEYMDFGGEGFPLIGIQGVHNYFDQQATNPYLQYTNKSWIEFYSQFTDKHKVLAPIKRGFGKTDEQLETETIQSFTEDILSLMDALGIQKAFFLGRDVAAQNMLYLAENYPERILGLIFIQPLFVFTDIQDEATDDYMYYNMTQSLSTQEYRNYKFKKSPLFRPKIFTDSTFNIDVPALLFYFPPISEETMEMRRIEGFIDWVEKVEKIEWSKEYSSKEIAAYFEKLSKDKSRMNHIRNYLKINNPNPKMYSSLKRAFGNKLVIFNESMLKSNDNRVRLLNLYYPVSKTFLFMNTEN